jgi:hypothetical protein
MEDLFYSIGKIFANKIVNLNKIQIYKIILINYPSNESYLKLIVIVF